MLLKSLLSLLLCTLASLQAAQEAPAPAASELQALPDPHLYALVIIPDLHRVLDNLQTLITTLDPTQSVAVTPADGLALYLHDPALKNLASTPVLLAVMPGVPAPSVACILPCADAQAYADAATQHGLAAKTVAGLAIIAQAPDAIDQALPLANRYLELTKQPIAADMRLLVAPDRLTSAYGPMLTMLSKTMLPLPPAQKSMLVAELSGLLTVLGDIDEIQSDISMSSGSLRCTQVQVARPGSDLAKALVGPAAHAFSASSHLQDRPLLMGFTGRFNVPAMATYCTTVLHAVTSSGDPSLKAVLTPAVLDEISKCFSSQGGDMAMEVVAKKGGWFVFDEAIASNDPAQLIGAQMGLMTTISSLSQTIVTQDLNVRKVGATVIDRFTTQIDTSKVPTANKAAMDAMVTPTELAAQGGFVYMSQEPASMDAMLTGATKGMTLKAQNLLPAGMDGYCDCDLPGLVSAMSLVFLPASAGTVPSVAASDPITACWSVASGQMTSQVRIPLSAMAAVSTQVQGITVQLGAGRAHQGGREHAPSQGKPPPPVF